MCDSTAEWNKKIKALIVTFKAFRVWWGRKKSERKIALLFARGRHVSSTRRQGRQGGDICPVEGRQLPLFTWGKGGQEVQIKEQLDQGGWFCHSTRMSFR